MTTTSSFPFSTMEIPQIEDNMEMASPYQDHADDFDIDIDVMEEQASNPDRDMTAADEYLDSSHGRNHDQDGSPDEDMIDDLAEPSMIDDGEQFHERNYNAVEMQYEDGKAYEAEMLEEEYDEDIDAPVPEPQEGVPLSEHTDSQATARANPTKSEDLPEEHTETSMEANPETGEESADQHESRPQGSEPVVDLGAQRTEEEVEIPSMEPNQTLGRTNETEQAGPGFVPADDHNENIEDSNELENARRDLNVAQPSANEPKAIEAKPYEKAPAEASESKELEAGQVHDPVAQMPLHPVKVYYQDNEISLFPPREGDSSETYFLEDESLAYGPFGKLFESCHEVLRDHINENEILVIDIEALNIQLTEESLHTYKFTLHQIIDIYLQLCHNDGIDEPEALYLTLGTKLTVTAEISALLLAASEGKRLSDIHSWEGYNEQEDISADLEENDQEPDVEEFQKASPPQDNGASLQEDQDIEAATHEQKVRTPPQNMFEPQENDGVEPNPHHESIGSVKDGEDDEGEVDEGEVDDEFDGPETQNDETLNYESSQADSYDSEEQKTESTATIDQLPLPNVEVEQEEEGEFAQPFHNDRYDQDEYYEEGERGDEAFIEKETNLEATGHIVDTEEAEDGNTAVSRDPDPQEHHVAPEYDEQALSGDVTTNNTIQDLEDVISSILQNDNNTEEPKPVLDGTLPLSNSQSPHLVDDPLGITEDLLKTPTKDSRTFDQGVGVEDANEAGDLGDVDEASYTSPSPAINNEAGELPFEDEEYLDLGITEGLEVFHDEGGANPTSPSHIPTKRSREPDDDEFDLPETTTPEVKRSRSS